MFLFFATYVWTVIFQDLQETPVPGRTFIRLLRCSINNSSGCQDDPCRRHNFAQKRSSSVPQLSGDCCSSNLCIRMVATTVTANRKQCLLLTASEPLASTPAFSRPGLSQRRMGHQITAVTDKANILHFFYWLGKYGLVPIAPWCWYYRVLAGNLTSSKRLATYCLFFLLLLFQLRRVFLPR